MKTVRLNLEDRQSWQKFQHVLTSFASDYIDLVAPEQTEFKFEQQVLSLGFTLIAATPDRERANYFTQSLENFLKRLRLVGVRRVELEFFAIGAESPVLDCGFDVPFIEPPATTTSIVRNSGQIAATSRRRLGGSLAQRVKGWLTNPQIQENFQAASRLVVRDPKGLLEAAKNSTVEKFSQTITWVDTFPWEQWAKQKIAGQKRRHRRNLFKALVEDFAVIALLIVCLFFAADFLSGPTLNLAAMPQQHYDSNPTGVRYRCGNTGLSLKNYVCLSRGMTYNQVASILGAEGKPLGIDNKFGDRAVIISWGNGEKALNATFKEDALVSKAQRNL